MLFNLQTSFVTHIKRGVLGLGLAIAFTFSLSATSITYNFDQTLAGVPPVGPTPWLTATFSDGGAGAVQLTLSAPGLTGDESVGQWFFNLDPTMDPSKLVFSETTSSGAFTTPTVATGADAFKPAYDGKYDILVNFDGSGDNSTKFGGADSVTYSITGITGLTASDFLFADTASAGHGELFAAAYIQTVGEAVIIDSPPEMGRPSVPDGGPTAMLLGLALLGIDASRRKLAQSVWATIR